MFIKDWKKEIFTIPNLLSLFRLLLIPVYVIIYLNAKDSSDYFLAGAILAVSCLTDLIDGKIARHFNMISNLGKVLDPIADKATQFTLILCLVMRYSVLWFLVGLFVIKEGFQVVAGGLSLRKGKVLNGALLTGKICTTVLFISLIVMVLIPTLLPSIVDYIVIVDSVFMLIALTDYVIAYYVSDSKLKSIDSNDEKS